MEDGSLLIAKVRSTDRGKYTCVRANEAGSVRGTAWLSVLVRTQIIQVTLLLVFKKMMTESLFFLYQKWCIMI